jgi:hypothetical protein
LDELLFDYEEVFKHCRRESAYWTHWQMAATWVKKLPDTLEEMTGEPLPQKPQREITPERKARLEKAMQIHKQKMQARIN